MEAADAQKNQTAQITAIEIDEEAYNQSIINFKDCPWTNRISAVHQSIQDFTLHQNTKFDFIISNPPFFVNSTKAPDNSRALARHNDILPFEDLNHCASQLLIDNGRFCVVIPSEFCANFLEIANKYKLFCRKKTWIKPIKAKPTHRVLLELSNKEGLLIENEIVIETEKRHFYTEDYKNLTRDFYLYFRDEKIV